MRPFTVLVLAVTTLAGSLTVTLADTPGSDWMPFEQVVQKVREAGYSQISELQADDGRWEGEGIKNGQKMEFNADPKTGEIRSEQPD